MAAGTKNDHAVLRLFLICTAPILLLVVTLVVMQRASTTQEADPVAETVPEQFFPDRAPPPLGPENPPSPRSFRPMRVVGEQAPITEIKLITAAEVEHEVDPDELVLGVVIDGQARAYPLNGLTGPAREIYNDVLADRPIAATW